MSAAAGELCFAQDFLKSFFTEGLDWVHLAAFSAHAAPRNLMNTTHHRQIHDGAGRFEARYLAFLETIATLRPGLHRYCARMTGSVMDGEDVVQEALFEAYRKLDQFDDSRPLKPWLFRIAHNRCIDFLRRRGVRDEADAAVAVPEAIEPAEPVLGTGKAVEHLVLTLPPKERACVLLKEYSIIRLR